MLSRVNTLEEGKGGPRNDTEERVKIESALTSLHQRISELEKGNGHGELGGHASCLSSLDQWDPASGPGFLHSSGWECRSPQLLHPSSPIPAPDSPVGVPGRTGVPWAWDISGSRVRKGLPGVPSPLPRHTHTLTHSQDFSKSDLFNLQQLCTIGLAGSSPPWLGKPGSSRSPSTAESRAWAGAGPCGPWHIWALSRFPPSSLVPLASSGDFRVLPSTLSTPPRFSLLSDPSPGILHAAPRFPSRQLQPAPISPEAHG